MKFLEIYHRLEVAVFYLKRVGESAQRRSFYGGCVVLRFATSFLLTAPLLHQLFSPLLSIVLVVVRVSRAVAFIVPSIHLSPPPVYFSIQRMSYTWRIASARRYITCSRPHIATGQAVFPNCRALV
jgi:hypothetical protein